MSVDGVPVPARHLVDGVTIQRVDVALVHYVHSELSTHGIVFAAGLPSESWLDIGNRDMFENASVASLIADLSRERTGLAATCAPLVTGGPALVAIRDRRAARRPLAKDRARAFGS